MDFLTIYTNYYQHIYRYALRLSCHPEDALDITQNTFLSALTHLDSLTEPDAVAGWLRSICYHKFIDATRSSRYLKEWDDIEALEAEGALAESTMGIPETEVLVEEDIRELQSGCFLAMVRKLTLNQRIAFSLTDMYGMPLEGVAGLLNISTSAAKGLLFRARMNIDSFFSGHCNLLQETNPCSCKAWIAFSSNRENMQKETHAILERLDYRTSGYVFDASVRAKVAYLYTHMPEKKPPEDWYQNFHKILEKKLINP